jgi:hypothetical protein
MFLKGERFQSMQEWSAMQRRRGSRSRSGSFHPNTKGTDSTRGFGFTGKEILYFLGETMRGSPGSIHQGSGLHMKKGSGGSAKRRIAGIREGRFSRPCPKGEL